MVVPVTEEAKTSDYEVGQDGQAVMDDMDFCKFQRKKKFASSSFYEEPNAIYPTVEEQVELCRKIADSLSNDCNVKSRGANMFYKRVKKAETWVHESSRLFESSCNQTENNNVLTDLSKVPYVKVSKGPPQLKLILDPRHIVDMKRLRQEGVNIVEHNAVSPEICHDIIKDLNSPTGKGAQLFAKRKKKSVEWVVDEEKVKALLRKQYGGGSDSCDSPEPDLPIKPLTHPRIQQIKSPWETPVKQLQSHEVAESVIKAAEAKIMTYPSPIVPVIEPGSWKDQDWTDSVPSHFGLQKSALSVTTASGTCRTDIYTSRAPKGWTRDSSAYSSMNSNTSFEEPSLPLSPVPTANLVSSETSTSRTYNFANFNKTPKAWSSELVSSRPSSAIKSVRPPSVLLQ